MTKQEKEEEKSSLTLNVRRDIFVYKDKDTDFIKSSNIPHLNVEDGKDWKSYKVGDNPNLIGQIHNIGTEVVFQLCFNPQSKRLRKEDLKAIIKGIEYVEDFIKRKKR